MQQSQLLTAIKKPIIGIIKKQINQEIGRNHSVLIPVEGNQPVSVNIKQTAGHWTLFGSVYISLDEFPVVYNNNEYQVDFTFVLMENGDNIGEILSDEMIFFYGVDPPIEKWIEFEAWLKRLILHSWNNVTKT